MGSPRSVMLPSNRRADGSSSTARLAIRQPCARLIEQDLCPLRNQYPAVLRDTDRALLGAGRRDGAHRQAHTACATTIRLRVHDASLSCQIQIPSSTLQPLPTPQPQGPSNLGVGSWEFGSWELGVWLGGGHWEWLGFGAWSWGFEMSHDSVPDTRAHLRTRDFQLHRGHRRGRELPRAIGGDRPFHVGITSALFKYDNSIVGSSRSRQPSRRGSLCPATCSVAVTGLSRRVSRRGGTRSCHAGSPRRRAVRYAIGLHRMAADVMR